VSMPEPSGSGDKESRHRSERPLPLPAIGYSSGSRQFSNLSSAICSAAAGLFLLALS
jgi:hypothetical protein